MLDFSWMTTSQIVALVLGIFFSIVSVATTFLAFKYAKKLNSFVKASAMTLIVPFFALTSWLFLILSFLDGFRKDEILNVIISVLIALFVCAVIIVVAKALYNRNRDRFEEDEANDLIEGTFEDQTNSLEAPVAAVLIANNEQEKSEEVVNSEKEEESVETVEEVAEEAPVEEVAAEEATEETPAEEETEEIKEAVIANDEETVGTEENAEVEETVETEENAEVEETEEITQETVKTPAEEETPVEENVEATESEETAVEENVEATESEETAVEENVESAETEETEAQEVAEEESDEDEEEDDDDEEFEKFLEALKARNAQKYDDNQDNE